MFFFLFSCLLPTFATDYLGIQDVRYNVYLIESVHDILKKKKKERNAALKST